ncbi:MAG TPA: molybdate ABC transporter substrate-binding protein [Casimicrobiaceae bacterium]|jgi:molybdate transport system substrate-binding protein|nr:molybdate ABC transporter substrate-binding protein [Casimicrobiaceae bacterium]
MTARTFAIIGAVLALAGSFAPAISSAQSITVFAAASLKEALDEQTARFEADTGRHVTVAYGASSALAKQIEAGAPASIFVSADLDWMDYLEQQSLLAQGSRTNLLGNSLVLIVPTRSSTSLKIAPGFALAAALGTDKLAIAVPESVPAGKYAREALQSLGVWNAVEKQTVRAENVRGALALVARGEAAFGIVYRTDALAEPAVRIVDTFPDSTHAPIVYPIALVKAANSRTAAAFADFLRSPVARAIWSKHGFVPL